MTADGVVDGRKIQSPNIDRLATQGIILSQNYVQEMCTPTRAALMTGRYPFRYVRCHCFAWTRGSIEVCWYMRATDRSWQAPPSPPFRLPRCST
jgi:hypothetical protein